MIRMVYDGRMWARDGVASRGGGIGSVQGSVRQFWHGREPSETYTEWIIGRFRWV